MSRPRTLLAVRLSQATQATLGAGGGLRFATRRLACGVAPAAAATPGTVFAGRGIMHGCVRHSRPGPDQARGVSL